MAARSMPTDFCSLFVKISGRILLCFRIGLTYRESPGPLRSSPGLIDGWNGLFSAEQPVCGHAEDIGKGVQLNV